MSRTFHVSGLDGVPLLAMDITPQFLDNVSFSSAWDLLACNGSLALAGLCNESLANGTAGNGTWLEPASDWLVMGLTSVVLGLMILATVIGNVFVIAAILMERNLQSVANYLIVSLAVADLMVACLVMPLGAVYEISKGWILGPELCDMWTSSDVLCCTASILHLVAIAVDRYWAVTNVDYIHSRNSRRIGIMIVMVWSVALIVSLAPQFGWKDPEFLDRINQQKCMVSQDVSYQIFATCSTFYLPLFVILVLYWKIFQTARKRIRRRVGNHAKKPPSVPKKDLIPKEDNSVETTKFTTQSANSSPEKSTTNNGAASHQGDVSKVEVMHQKAGVSGEVKKEKEKKESLEAKRERKAAKTLAIITGAFVMCWLPFFICALLMPLCASCYFDDYMLSAFLWLGYFNSTLNPIIYTIFSPEFRQAFKRILCGKPKPNYRTRKLH